MQDLKEKPEPTNWRFLKKNSTPVIWNPNGDTKEV